MAKPITPILLAAAHGQIHLITTTLLTLENLVGRGPRLGRGGVSQAWATLSGTERRNMGIGQPHFVTKEVDVWGTLQV